MKPTWDKLMKTWNAAHTDSIVADVDCTGKGKALCDEVGVKGYPTIKWGDPSNLETYSGGRDYAVLEKFAKENLKPLCSPVNIHLCDEEKKKEITDLQSMPIADLEALVAEKNKLLKELDENFDAGVKELQETYQKLQKEKDDKIAEIKNSGLGLMTAVLSSAKAASKEDSKDEL